MHFFLTFFIFPRKGKEKLLPGRQTKQEYEYMSSDLVSWKGLTFWARKLKSKAAQMRPKSRKVFMLDDGVDFSLQTFFFLVDRKVNSFFSRQFQFVKF